MKYYVYLDLDSHIGLRSLAYVEEDNPGFFSQNSHSILKHWKVDSDDIRSIWNVLKYCSDRRVHIETIRNFLITLGIEPNQKNLEAIARANSANITDENTIQP